MRLHGPLCAGIDPHPEVLAEWGLSDDVAGLERFCVVMLEALGGRIAAVKPQSAFFERHGSAGIAVLERLLAGLEQAGTLSILDVKRGDIGSTMRAYADAYLSAGAPLAADAITLSPYLGYESLRPAIDVARAHGRGVFVLALTSNPEGETVQHQGSPAVAAHVVEQVRAENELATAAQEPATTDPGDIGLVLGATAGDAMLRLGITAMLPDSRTIILAPGVGAQGATLADVASAFARHTDHVLVPVSRGLTSAGSSVDEIRSASDALGQELQNWLG